MILPSWFDPLEPYRVSPFIFEQAQALRRSGVNVGILYVGFSGRTCEFHNREVDGIRILSITLPHILRRMRQLSLTILCRTYEFLYRTYSRQYGEPTLIHGHSMYAAGVCAAELSRRHERPFVVTEHFSGYSLGKLKDWQLKLIRDTVDTCSRILFVSDTLRRNFTKHVPTNKWEILPNNYSERLKEHIQPFVPVSHRSYFCIVARLDSNKNVELCLRAFAMLSVKSHDLVVVGSGVERTKLEQIALELQIAERVIFFGTQSRDNTFAIMKGAEALVVSSIYETFGMTVLEAAVLGTPIISTKCGGPAEILGDDFGLLVQNDDAEGLANAMQNALTDKEIFRCALATHIVSSTYCPSTIATRLNLIYRTVINEKE
jgi:glycosyltransferase involved in cell wall biosynthesis